jgi:hypothetical protein
MMLWFGLMWLGIFWLACAALYLEMGFRVLTLEDKDEHRTDSLGLHPSDESK